MITDQAQVHTATDEAQIRRIRKKEAMDLAHKPLLAITARLHSCTNACPTR